VGVKIDGDVCASIGVEISGTVTVRFFVFCRGDVDFGGGADEVALDSGEGGEVILGGATDDMDVVSVLG